MRLHQNLDRQDYILVFDRFWSQSTQLYYEVQKTSWNDVILDEDMKKTLTHTIEEFFDNESKYKDLDVPWKVGTLLCPRRRTPLVALEELY